jgi:hypothetical protein
MARHFVAFIRADDYPAFKHLLRHELPQGYGRWQKKHDVQILKIMAADRNRPEVLGIPVRPDGFARFCAKKHLPHTVESLDKYATALAQKND